MKNTTGPIEEILSGLEAQSEMLSKEELKAELLEAGVNVERLLAKANQLVKKHLKEERTAWMKTADQKNVEFEAASKGVSSWLSRTEDEIYAAFKLLIGTGGPAVAFRNQGKLSFEDMARILDQNDELKARPAPEADGPTK